MADINWIIGGITGVATVTLAIITWRYARHTKDYVSLTREILEENRQMRLDALRPKIRLFLRRPDSSSMVLGVRNIGASTAKNIEFTMIVERLADEPSIDDTPRPEFPEFLGFPEFPEDVRYLASGQKIEGTIDPRLVRDQPGQSTSHINVVYEDSMNNKYLETVFLNSQLHHSVTEIDLLFDIRNTLQSIGESLSSISQQMKKD